MYTKYQKTSTRSFTNKLDPLHIKQEISPLDFYTHELPDAVLIKDNWNDGGLCPFHNDGKPGSFYVNLETGTYNCFSCGAKGGDVIAFTMAIYELSFFEALVKLSEEWGV